MERIWAINFGKGRIWHLENYNLFPKAQNYLNIISHPTPQHQNDISKNSIPTINYIYTIKIPLTLSTKCQTHKFVSLSFATFIAHLKAHKMYQKHSLEASLFFSITSNKFILFTFFVDNKIQVKQ
jgi:hypothetical protein